MSKTSTQAKLECLEGWKRFIESERNKKGRKSEKPSSGGSGRNRGYRN